jgi:hypothetical protein
MWVILVGEVEREDEEEGFLVCGFLGILELCVKVYMSV